MKRVNLCAASIPHTPCALTRALAHALRQPASNVIDARLTQPTQWPAIKDRESREAPREIAVNAGSMAAFLDSFSDSLRHSCTLAGRVDMPSFPRFSSAARLRRGAADE